MRKLWFVIEDGNFLTSYDAKKEQGERFLTKRGAQKRAVHLANSEPGKLFWIAETIQFADAEVQTATYKTL